MGTIVKVQRKAGASYKVIIRQRGLSPITKTFKSKSAARAWLKRVEADDELCRARGNRNAAGKTASDLIDSYIHQYQKKDLGRLAILAYWKDRIGTVKVGDLDSDLIMDERELLLSEPGKRCGKKRQRTGATVNRYMSALSAVFRVAIEQRVMRPGSNPCIGLPRGKEKHRFGRALSDAERDALLEACTRSEWDRMHLMVTMALSTGARKGELLSLSWNDLDFTRRTALLDKTKNGEPRTLLLVKAVIELLDSLPRPLDGTKLLFPREGDDHKQIVSHVFYAYWKAVKAAAGVENFRFHDLRHSAASYMVENNIPLVKVAAILGHKTMSMVQRYSHLETEESLDAMERLFADKLGG